MDVLMSRLFPPVILFARRNHACAYYHLPSTLPFRAGKAPVVIVIPDDPLKIDGLAEVLAGEDGVGAELLLDTQDLVELGKALGTCGSPSLDLS